MILVLIVVALLRICYVKYFKSNKLKKNIIDSPTLIKEVVTSPSSGNNKKEHLPW